MTTQINLTSEQPQRKSTLKRLLWVSPLAMVFASGANLALYAVAGSLFPEVAAWPGAGPAQIIGASVVYLFVASIVAAVIARWAKRPARAYTWVATVALVLSMAMPISAAFSSPPADPATIITLCLMHVVSYAISVPMFVRLALD